MAGIVAIRLVAFLSGWMLMTNYGDWRQAVGYPLLLAGALPDGLLVRYAISPTSRNWPSAMVVSVLLSSAILAGLVVRARPSSQPQ